MRLELFLTTLRNHFLARAHASIPNAIVKRSSLLAFHNWQDGAGAGLGNCGSNMRMLVRACSRARGRACDCVRARAPVRESHCRVKGVATFWAPSASLKQLATRCAPPAPPCSSFQPPIRQPTSHQVTTISFLARAHSLLLAELHL